MQTRTLSTASLPTTATTLVDLLRQRSTHQPTRPAYTFLADGETVSEQLTFADVDHRARAIGARLQEMQAAGERVLLLYPSGLDYITAFFGCLYAGAIAVPMYPPRMNRSVERLQSIVADCQATIALTTSDLLDSVEQWHTEAAELAHVRWLATDTVETRAAAAWETPAIDSDTIAFLQYTSGSTAAPKGVMVSHGNLLHNQHMSQQALGHSEHTVIVSWLPLYHDLGLGNVIQALYLGASCILMPPVVFLQRPMRWLQAISRYRASTSGAPNFAYELCVRKITPEQRAELDLSSWEVAFTGAEPIRKETLDLFAQAFASCGFQYDRFSPGYGLAEATLMVSGNGPAAAPVFHTVQKTALARHRIVAAPPGEAEAQTLVGCGPVQLDQKVVTVDPETRLQCAADRVGEIWVAGDSVAQGYWHHTDATAEAFQAHLADTGEGPFLRTGDLGFMYHGELFITGRLKDVIVIRGANHYPQDIELTVERSHPSLRPGCGAAFTIDVDDEERLVVVQEVERRYQPPQAHGPERRREDVDPNFEPAAKKFDAHEVTSRIRQTVSEEHGLQVHAILLLRVGSIPKTSSGKLQRRACQAAFLENSLSVVGAWQARREPAKGQLIGLAHRANTPPKRQRQGKRVATTLPRPRPSSPLSQPAAA